MNAPAREYRQHAAVPVRRQKGKLLHKHWLTVASIFALMGAAGFLGVRFNQTEQALQQVRTAQAQWEARLSEARQTNQRLQVQLNKAKDDSNMELAAKGMGFVYPQESVYQTNPGSGH